MQVICLNAVSFPDLVPLSPVRNMDVYDEQTTAMRVRWEEVDGATGYILRYDAINATQPTIEQEVRGVLRKYTAT